MNALRDLPAAKVGIRFCTYTWYQTSTPVIQVLVASLRENKTRSQQTYDPTQLSSRNGPERLTPLPQRVSQEANAAWERLV